MMMSGSQSSWQPQYLGIGSSLTLSRHKNLPAYQRGKYRIDRTRNQILNIGKAKSSSTWRSMMVMFFSHFKTLLRD